MIVTTYTHRTLGLHVFEKLPIRHIQIALSDARRDFDHSEIDKSIPRPLHQRPTTGNS